MSILDLLLFGRRGGGVVPPPVNPWVAGADTTLSTDAVRERITANIGGVNPRAWKVYTTADLIVGATYRWSGHNWKTGATAGNSFNRVSSSSGLPSGDIGQFITVADGEAFTLDFVMPNFTVYIGWVMVAGTAGDFGETEVEQSIVYQSGP